MTRTTLVVALVLAALGVGFYAGTGGASLTALIPTAVGVLLLACWAVARTSKGGRYGIYAALAVAVISVFGSLTNVAELPALVAGAAARPAAIVESTVMFVLLVGYLAQGVRWFPATRTGRKPSPRD